MDPLLLKRVLEAVLMAAAQPLSLNQLVALFSEEEAVDNEQVAAALAALAEDCAERGIELKEVASGFRYQIREDVHAWVARLWTERQTKYSRALLETLALIAYRQPITRAEIEQIRGVAVSTSIVKTLEEREWVRVVGYRDVPGRPALFGTSRNFLDYFNLKSLDELPPLAEIRDLDDYDPQLDLAPVVPPSLELPPEDQEAAAAEAAAQAAAAAGDETGADEAATDDGDSDQAVAGTADDRSAASGESAPDAEAGQAADHDAAETTAAASAADEFAAKAAASSDADAIETPAASDDSASEDSGSNDSGSDESASDESAAEDSAGSGSREDSTGPDDSAGKSRDDRTISPAPSAHAPAGEDFAEDALEDAPEADDDWSDARETALDSDTHPDFADSDFSPDDDDVDPPETTTSDDVPEHNA